MRAKDFLGLKYLTASQVPLFARTVDPSTVEENLLRAIVLYTVPSLPGLPRGYPFVRGSNPSAIIDTPTDYIPLINATNNMDPEYIKLGQAMGYFPKYMDADRMTQHNLNILNELLKDWSILNEVGLAWEQREETEQEPEAEPTSPNAFGLLYEDSSDEEED